VRFLHIDRAKCTGCRVCEYVCALERGGGYNPLRSRIRVQRPGPLERRTLVCLQCKQPRCMEACPTRAIYRDGEHIRVHAELCDRCGACILACDRLFLPPEGAILMCDQCGACVARCPEGALGVTTPQEIRRSRKEQKKGANIDG
jgi:Fe-S-cluster-containing hydrogenase component 2